MYFGLKFYGEESVETFKQEQASSYHDMLNKASAIGR